MSEKVKAAALSYFRAAAASVPAIYKSGITDPKVLANAFIAGLIGPILKALDPKDSSIGLGSK